MLSVDDKDRVKWRRYFVFVVYLGYILHFVKDSIVGFELANIQVSISQNIFTMNHYDLKFAKSLPIDPNKSTMFS